MDVGCWHVATFCGDETIGVAFGVKRTSAAGQHTRARSRMTLNRHGVPLRPPGLECRESIHISYSGFRAIQKIATIDYDKQDDVVGAILLSRLPCEMARSPSVSASRFHP